MNRDDIIRMAREAGIDDWWESGNEMREVLQVHLERFADMVAAHEREECAKVCDAIRLDHWNLYKGRALAIGAEECADAIRARSKQ